MAVRSSATKPKGRTYSVTGILSEVSTMPRPQAGPAPQHLLITLLGDFWLGPSQPLPSTTIARLMAEFGFGESASRTAISRLARRGALEMSRRGRRTAYGLTPEVIRSIMSGGHEIAAFTVGSFEWDGMWTIASFEVPSQRREIRHMLRARMQFLGFAPLLTGVWVSLRCDPATVLTEFEEYRLTRAMVVRTGLVEGPMSPLRAWRLDDLRAAYDGFIRQFLPVAERARSRRLSERKALIARASLMDEWRRFPGSDPGFPDDLLPDDWPRTNARDLFVELYDSLAPVASDRVRHLVAADDAELADLVVVRTVAELLSLPHRAP
jgi:phenylacetic acid degradation operon negative regulatory protein